MIALVFVRLMPFFAFSIIARIFSFCIWVGSILTSCSVSFLYSCIAFINFWSDALFLLMTFSTRVSICFEIFLESVDAIFSRLSLKEDQPIFFLARHSSIEISPSCLATYRQIALTKSVSI